MGIDVHNCQIRKVFMYDSDRRSGEGMLTPNCKGELPELQDFAYGITCDLEGGSMIHAAILQGGRNNCDAGSGRVPKGCIWGTKLGHKRFVHIVRMLLLFSAPPI